jgi:SAM-dependent methyltransferase
MPDASGADRSNGYDAAAAEFMSRRARSDIGAAAVRDWARALPPDAAVLDLGCGHGIPISAALIDAGAVLYGVDASPRMIAAFRSRFPGAPAQCSAVEDSDFFGRTFNGIVAWGLMFLLTPEAQAQVIAKVATALRPGGRFLFTSPAQPCEWSDIVTGRTSVSLGAAEYSRLLRASGLHPIGNAEDEGHNYYYEAAVIPLSTMA